MTLARWALTGLVSLNMHFAVQAAETDPALRGKGLVEEKCARCHAIDATGESPHRDAPPFRTLASRWPLEHLEEALAEGIVTGHPDMPAFAFEPDDIDAILEYMHSLNEPEEGASAKE